MHRLLLCLFAGLIFEVQALYCQTDTLMSQNHPIDNNKASLNSEKFSFRGGIFVSANNGGITLGSKQAGLGVVLDLEDALALQTSSFVFRATSNLRFGKRNHSAIILDYFGINRKASKTLEAELELGDNVYPVGTVINTKFNLSIIRAKYEYAFLQDDRVSLGFSAGFYIIPINFSVRSGDFKDQSASLVAPLPVVGLRSDFLITKKLGLKESAEILYLKYDNFVGSILDLNIALEHRTFKHFGFGAGFNANKIALTAKGKDYPAFDFFGSMKLDYTGFYAFVSFYL